MQQQKANGEYQVRHISQIETVWTVLKQAHGGQPEEINLAQQMILQRYQPAVFRYLMACLRDADAADELNQEFALRFVRGDFRNANPEKGRFRDLLKSALYHLIVDYHKRKQRGMAQLSPDSPEPVVTDSSVYDSDRQFLDSWRTSLLNKAWEMLAEDERQNEQPVHAVLKFRAAQPDWKAAQMAESLSEQLGKKVSADWVRKWLHIARERFAHYLLKEVGASLRDPDAESLEQELIDLELYQYCKVALDRMREPVA